MGEEPEIELVLIESRAFGGLSLWPLPWEVKDPVDEWLDVRYR
jgi:hypothetical protein